MQFTWQGRRLDTATVNGSNLSFRYDTDGVRAQKTVDGVATYYTLDGTRIIRQKTGNTVLYFEYDAAGNVATVTYGGNTYYYVRNTLSNITGLTDDEGHVVVTYTYDPFGKLLSVTDNSGTGIGTLNPFRYKGYYYDTETGLYYLNSRYYDPEIGRFIAPDAIEVLTATPMGLTDKNLFAYCDNNPVMRADHGGDFWHIVAGAIIGGAFELGSQLLSGEEINWAKVGVATLAGGVTAAVGPIAGAAISGVANIALDAMSGERDIKKLALSGVIGVGSSLIGSGAGKVVEKIGGKVASKAISKMSNAKIKQIVTTLLPAIKGSERNAIKSMTYLNNQYPDVGIKYFMSSPFGRTLSSSIGQMAEGLTGFGANDGIRRFFPSW